jgi:hypothetical protein
MSTTQLQQSLAAATSVLAPYALMMIGANAIMQVVIMLTGNEIGFVPVALTVVIALGYAGFLLAYGRRLAKVRFGLLAAHVMTYTAVNAGFLLHFFILAATGSPAVHGPGEFVMDPRWFGVVIGMPTFWGLGLLIHSLGAILGRGFEASR